MKIYRFLSLSISLFRSQKVSGSELKNKDFKDESMTKVESYAIGTSTTLESNKSPVR